LVHPPVNDADCGLIGGGSDFVNDPLAEQGNLLLSFGYQSGQPPPDQGAMRHARESHRLAQALVFLQQLAEFAVAERAHHDGDGGEQQERHRREITLLATLGRRGRRRLVVFFDAFD